jgi:hypothetical protein
MNERETAIQRLRELLRQRMSPRLHMLTLVGATAACGLLSSFLLLKAGISTMALRYPLAVGFAYCAFLALVAVWLRRFQLRVREMPPRSDRGGNLDLDFDVIEVPLDGMWDAASIPKRGSRFGGGGGFSGGGSSSTIDQAASVAFVPSPPSGGSPAGGGGGGGWDLDLDEGALWLIPVVIVAVLALGVVIYVVYTAPALFAELLLDAGLAAGLYRRLTRIERRSWLVTAVRNTLVPACFVAGLLGIAGGIMQAVYPDTVSIGGVAHQVLNPSRKQPNGR